MTPPTADGLDPRKTTNVIVDQTLSASFGQNREALALQSSVEHRSAQQTNKYKLTLKMGVAMLQALHLECPLVVVRRLHLPPVEEASV